VVQGSDIASAQIQDWANDFHALGECEFLTDIPGTVLCLTDNRVHLKSLMGRLSYMAEGKTHSLAPTNDLAYNISKQARYSGHDIAGADFNAFFEAVLPACGKNKYFCLNNFESDLADIVQTEVSRRGLQNFVVLGVSVSPGLGEDVSHELSHARYFLSATYRQAVSDFWNNQVSLDDQTAIAERLAETYNIQGEKGKDLLMNEFQAYLSEQGAESDVLRDYFQKYGPALRRILLAVGLG
jgi:hypothetical protein